MTQNQTKQICGPATSCEVILSNARDFLLRSLAGSLACALLQFGSKSGTEPQGKEWSSSDFRRQFLPSGGPAVLGLYGIGRERKELRIPPTVAR